MQPWLANRFNCSTLGFDCLPAGLRIYNIQNRVEEDKVRNSLPCAFGSSVRICRHEDDSYEGKYAWLRQEFWCEPVDPESKTI